jgi:hypothetical protein
MKMSRILSLASLIGAITAVSSGMALAQTPPVPVHDFRICTGDFALCAASTCTNYGVMFGSAYGLTLGVWFALAGLLASGPALSIEMGRRDVRRVHPVCEALAFGLLRAVSFGTAGWLSKDSQFGINFGIFCAVGFVAAT